MFIPPEGSWVSRRPLQAILEGKSRGWVKLLFLMPAAPARADVYMRVCIRTCPSVWMREAGLCICMCTYARVCVCALARACARIYIIYYIYIYIIYLYIYYIIYLLFFLKKEKKQKKVYIYYLYILLLYIFIYYIYYLYYIIFIYISTKGV